MAITANNSNETRFSLQAVSPCRHSQHLYQISTKNLGKGTYGAVVQATNAATGSPVAVKFHGDTLPHYLAAQNEAEYLNQFERMDVPHRLAMRALADTSPQKGEKNRKQWIVTDMLRTNNLLDEFIRNQETSLSFDELITIAKQSLEFLSALSKCRLVHGDFKTNNIAFDRSSRYLTVFDYGGTGSDLKQACKYMQGTSFKAPEVILDGPPGSAIDIWGLASTLFNMITRSRLFPVGRHQDNVLISDNILLHLMTREWGFPTRAYLQNCRLANCFFLIDQEGEVKFKQPLTQLPELAHWQERIRGSELAKTISAQKTEQLIQLLEQMFRYENRASAQDLLKAELFKEDVCFKLELPSTFSAIDKIELRRSCDTNLEIFKPQPAVVIVEGGIRVLRTCYHLPKDPADEYYILITRAGMQVLLQALKIDEHDIVKIHVTTQGKWSVELNKVAQVAQMVLKKRKMPHLPVHRTLFPPVSVAASVASSALEPPILSSEEQPPWAHLLQPSVDPKERSDKTDSGPSKRQKIEKRLEEDSTESIVEPRVEPMPE